VGSLHAVAESAEPSWGSPKTALAMSRKIVCVKEALTVALRVLRQVLDAGPVRERRERLRLQRANACERAGAEGLPLVRLGEGRQRSWMFCRV